MKGRKRERERDRKKDRKKERKKQTNNERKEILYLLTQAVKLRTPKNRYMRILFRNYYL